MLLRLHCLKLVQQSLRTHIVLTAANVILINRIPLLIFKKLHAAARNIY